MVQLPLTVRLSGVSFGNAQSNIKTFGSPDIRWFALVREPDNQHDSNAIRVALFWVSASEAFSGGWMRLRKTNSSGATSRAGRTSISLVWLPAIERTISTQRTKPCSYKSRKTMETISLEPLKKHQKCTETTTYLFGISEERTTNLSCIHAQTGIKSATNARKGRHICQVSVEKGRHICRVFSSNRRQPCHAVYYYFYKITKRIYYYCKN